MCPFAFIFCIPVYVFNPLLFFQLFDSVHVIIAIGLVLASLAAPTDPSATLGCKIHEYKKQRVRWSSTMNGEIAAFDDIVALYFTPLVTAFAASLFGKSNI